MATMAEKMAASLEELRKLQEKDRCVVLQGTAEIGRTHLIVDETDVYHIGASLKDLGKKMFAFSKLDIPAAVITDLL